MIRNSTATAGACDFAGAVVIDFEAQKAARLERRLDAAAPTAAVALARLDAGQGEWRALAAALVAPFNP
jgi:hypothetical protein